MILRLFHLATAGQNRIRPSRGLPDLATKLHSTGHKNSESKFTRLTTLSYLISQSVFLSGSYSCPCSCCMYRLHSKSDADADTAEISALSAGIPSPAMLLVQFAPSVANSI